MPPNLPLTNLHENLTNLIGRRSTLYVPLLELGNGVRLVNKNDSAKFLRSDGRKI